MHYGKIDLKGTGDEQTAVRFRLDSEGNVLGTNRLQKRLLSRAHAFANSSRTAAVFSVIERKGECAASRVRT